MDATYFIIDEPPTFADSLSLIFTGLTTDGFSLSQLVHSIDGITQATPLDSAKIFYNLHQGDESVFHDFVKLPILLQTGLTLLKVGGKSIWHSCLVELY